MRSGRIFHADFHLPGRFRLERTVKAVGAGNGRKRFAVAGVRRQAVRRQVSDAGAARECPGLAQGRGHWRCQQVALFLARPVLAPAHGEDPVAVLRTVLQVRAQLPVMLAAQGVGRQRRQVQRAAVDGAVDIDLRTVGDIRAERSIAAAVVDAGNDFMAQRACRHLTRHAGVERVHAALAVTRIDLAVGDRLVDQIAVTKHILFMVIRVQVAEVLPDRPSAVEGVARRVASGCHTRLLVVEAGLPQETRQRQAAVGITAVQGLPLHIRRLHGAILLDKAQQGDAGAGARCPRQAGRQIVAVVLHVIDLLVRIARQPHQAVLQAAIVRQLAAHVEGQLLARVAAKR